MVAQSTDKSMYMLELKPSSTENTPDTREIAELEPMSMPVPLVYHAYYINVYDEPQQSYHNSFWSSAHLLFILGLDQVCTTRVLPWHDRLQGTKP